MRNSGFNTRPIKQIIVVGIILTLLYPLLAIAKPDTEVGATDITAAAFTLIIDGQVQEVEKLEPKPAPYETNPQPTLLQICSCESGNGKYGTPQQFEADGVTVLVGKLTPSHLGKDIGMCQINTLYHSETATSLGFDLYTAEGNWGYANYLYNTQGTKPWSASAKCWGA